MEGRETLTLVALSRDFSCPGKMREFGMIVRLTAALLKPRSGGGKFRSAGTSDLFGALSHLLKQWLFGR
jgi:hypothetical protein